MSAKNFPRILLSVIVLATVHGRAEERTNVRSMSMARTGVALSRGLDAVGLNPAGLALPEGGTVTIGLFPLGAHVGSDFLDYGLYTKYFTGVESEDGRVARFLSDEDLQDLLNHFDEDVGRFGIDVEARLFGLSVAIENVGGFAFTVTDRGAAQVLLPRDYIEFMANGNPPGSFYDFSETDVRASWTRAYALSFGTEIPVIPGVRWMGAGASVKLVHGFAYYEVERFNTTLHTSDNATLTGTVDFRSRSSKFEHDVKEYRPFPQPAGKGFGIDIGVASAVNDYLVVAMSVTDIGSVLWKKHVEDTYADTTLIVDDPLRSEQREAVEDVVEGNTYPGSAFTSRLPAVLRVGVAVNVRQVPAFSDISGEMVVALDYHQGLVEAPGNTSNPRFSLGVEYIPLDWLPLRTGISVGGTDGFNYALGFGVHFGVFSFDIGSENVTWLFQPKSFARGSLAMGMKLKF